MSRTRKTGAAFMNALMEEMRTQEDVQGKDVIIRTQDGQYNFSFEEEGFTPPVDHYDIDIDLIPGTKVQSEIVERSDQGFVFVVLSKGVHFTPQPVDCSKKEIKASVTVTQTLQVDDV